MALEPERVREPLERFLASALRNEACRITRMTRLAGGTIQDNWFIEVQAATSDAPARRVVLRTGRVVGVNDSLPAQHEYAVLCAAARAGVRVPQPIAVCIDPDVIGRPFFVMDFVDGESRPWKLQRTPEVMASGESIVEEIGAELGRLQTITPEESDQLSFLKPPPRDVAREAIADMRTYLDRHDHPHPALEYALRWLERHAPGPGPVVLCHGDFRLGNVTIAGGKLSSILDWERTRWGDPYESLAWFCLRFFRFARPDLIAGGLGSRAALLRGWQAVSGRMPDPEAIRYWDIMANTGWAVISLQQVARQVFGGENSLELALVGLATGEIELEALSLIAQADAGSGPEQAP
jgi:aminoglycoside phosphotransferase (APT) family kinase protein